MSEHKKTITAISWCPGNPDLFVSASADNLLIIWNVAEQKAVARLDNTKGQLLWTRRFSRHWALQVGFIPLCPPLLSQASPRQLAGAGTHPMVWRLCPSVDLCISGCMGVLTPGSRCTKKPTPSYLISASSDGIPTRRANWCLDTPTEACPSFSQVWTFLQLIKRP